MTEIREIHEDELDRWVATTRAALDETDTVEGYLDWKRQARETVWLLATEDGRDVGTAIGIGGWHSPEGVARGEVRVVPDARGRGVGSDLLSELSAWAHRPRLRRADGAGQGGRTTRRSPGRERRGFDEVGPQLAARARPDARSTPRGRRRRTGSRSSRGPSDPELAAAMYEVAREAYPDVPGEDDAEMAPFEEWLSMDMQGAGDRPGGDVRRARRATRSSPTRSCRSRARGPTVAMHDITGVRRAWRGRGIAGALKAAEIAWAKENGYERLETQNEERNEPIRRLNERYGYVVTPGSVTVRGRIR